MRLNMPWNSRLIPPDATTLRGTAAWTQDPASMPRGRDRYVFAVKGETLDWLPTRMLLMSVEVPTPKP